MPLQFGLLGKHISYSFSESYFTQKFNQLQLPYKYQVFDIESITDLLRVLSENPNLRGLNVTIPYKEEIIPYLDEISPIAQTIGAVNVIKISINGTITGYNSDYYGFSESLKPLLQPHHQQALILGTGGASKAVAYALSKLGITYQKISRTKTAYDLLYTDINPDVVNQHTLIINTTPLGTFPSVEQYPPFPTQYLTAKHLVYDLIYNPAETQLLKKAKEKGATIKNGYEMLILQAEKSWEIWTK